jgi:outer membrane lipoprotein-sorting protein
MHVDRAMLEIGLTRRGALLLGIAAIAPALVPGAASAQEQDASQLLQQAATKMAGVQSFHFQMSIPRGKSLLADQIELAGFEGDVQRPDRFRVSFTAKAAILSLTLKVIGIGDQLWVTDPMSEDEAWIQLSTGEAGDIPLPDILNPDRLLQAAVDVIQEPKIAGEDEIDGVKTTRVVGLFDPRQVNQQVNELTGTPMPELSALTGDTVIPVSLWIDDAGRVLRVEFEGPLTAADEGDVIRRFDITKIDEPVDIQPPS